jgi:predicted hydrocarbon binding protein
MNPFFVLPASALISLREELELLAGDWAGETLERTGFRAGMSLVSSLDITATKLEDFAEVFSQLWSEAGLSSTAVERASEEEIVVSFKGSVEATSKRRCDFTRGYLEGIASGLLGRRYQATEVMCMSQGAERCVHRLLPSDMPLHASRSALVTSERKYHLEPGCSYLIESDDSREAFQIMEDYLAHGTPGMCITREYPDRLRKAFNLEGGQLIWLSYERDLTISREPTNIPLIYSEIKAFLEENDEAIFLISGLEYLVSQTNFVKILKFVQLLTEAAAVHNSIFLLPMSPGALAPREVKLLEREFQDIRHQCHDGRDQEVTEQEE